MKKIISIIMLISIMLSHSINVMANENLSFSKKESTLLNIAVSAAIRLNSSNKNEDILKEGSVLKRIEPLYNQDNIVAYYISFNPSGYAVVSSNPENPAVIEFGEGEQENIENLISSNDKITYNNPVDIYSGDRIPYNMDADRNLYTYFPELKEKDPILLNEISSVKESLSFSLLPVEQIQPFGDGDYGFYDWGNMPDGKYEHDTIKESTSTMWLTMDEVKDIANNHCGATAVTNLALYFRQRGNRNLKINDSKRSTFIEVHKIVGNGPKMTITENAVQYFSSRGYHLNYSDIASFFEVKRSIGKDHILAILLANGIFDWHWILGVGYREYDNGDEYIRIVNGWDNTTYKYYKINKGSLWFSTTQFWLE